MDSKSGSVRLRQPSLAQRANESILPLDLHSQNYAWSQYCGDFENHQANSIRFLFQDQPYLFHLLG